MTAKKTAQAPAKTAAAKKAPASPPTSAVKAKTSSKLAPKAAAKAEASTAPAKAKPAKAVVSKPAAKPVAPEPKKSGKAAAVAKATEAADSKKASAVKAKGKDKGKGKDSVKDTVKAKPTAKGAAAKGKPAVLEEDLADVDGDIEGGDDVEAEIVEVAEEVKEEKVKPLRMKVSRAKERALMREFGLDETTLTEEEVAKRRHELKTLIKMGKTRGFLTHQEISDHLPERLVNDEILEAIVSMLNDMGIAVYEQAPDAATLLIAGGSTSTATEEEAEEAAEAALSTVDSEFGRTTDPVRMYMREMGTVELLTREGEIVKLPSALKKACSEHDEGDGLLPRPRSAHILKEYDGVDAEERRLSDMQISEAGGRSVTDEEAEVLAVALCGNRSRRNPRSSKFDEEG